MVLQEYLVALGWLWRDVLVAKSVQGFDPKGARAQGGELCKCPGEDEDCLVFGGLPKKWCVFGLVFVRFWLGLVEQGWGQLGCGFALDCFLA